MFQIKHGVALIALAYASVVFADDLPEFNGDDVIVTASGVPQAKGIAPVSVSVITDKDIAKSSASTVQDVLATAGGVHLIKNGGTSAMVDLGGFGMTGSSNTLILVDGVRQNTNDLAAPDLSYIPLSSIERIEIVRRSGAVQYGDGATGGVINIITKAGDHAENHARISQMVGSFNLRQTDASFNVAGERISLDGFAQSMNTDHYRDNSAERRDGGGLGINWKLDEGAVRLYARTSSDSQGMAGVRSVDPSHGVNQFNSNPAGATTPFDHSTIKTNLIGLQGNHKLGVGQLYFELASRDKTTLTNYVSYSSRDARKLNEDTGSVRYVLPFAAANQWMVGYDWLSGDATLAKDNMYPLVFSSPQTASSVKQRHQALFSEAQFGLWDGARATIGGRVQRIDDHLTCSAAYSNSNGCQEQGDNRELHAWQLALRQVISAQWGAYAKLGQSFRLPNADEAVSSSGVLLPQLSHDQELGVEWARDQASLHIAAFRSDVTNEIQYNPYTFQNSNVDPTRHQGLEFEGKVPLSSSIFLEGNLTWQKVTFRSGRYNNVDLNGKLVPMVPAWLANLGVAWVATEQTRMNLSLNYVGAQRLDNDQNNQFANQLAAYTVVDAKLMHQFSKSISGAFAINNLLDRHFATYGIASTSSTRYSLYPADPRNYQASLTWAF